MASQGTEKFAFKVSDLSKSWGRTCALSELNLRIEKGKVTLLVGPSGSGKSTLLSLLAAALKPSGGRVYEGDRDLSTLSSKELRLYRRRSSIIEQAGLLVPELSVHQNVLMGLARAWPWHTTLNAFFRTAEREKVFTLLSSLGLSEKQWERCSVLSGGQQQRVAIARALISKPEFLFADEPTSSLDPSNAKEVTRIIAEQSQERGQTAIICTHWLSLALPYADRVVGLRKGKLAFDLASSAVKESHLESLYEGSDERI